MKKKLFASVLSIVVSISVISAASLTVAAAEESKNLEVITLQPIAERTFDEFEYIELSDGTLEITNYLGSDVEMAIPYKIDGKVVSSIGDSAFAHNEELEYVFMYGSVTNIADTAFDGCEKVEFCSYPDTCAFKYAAEHGILCIVLEDEDPTNITDPASEPAITINSINPIAEGMHYLYYSFSYSNWDGQNIIVSIYDGSGIKLFDDGELLIRDSDGSIDSSVGFFDPMIEADKTYVITLSSADGAVKASREFTACSAVELYGDVNGDGEVTTADVGLANSFAKGAKEPTQTEFLNADLNVDGKISTADVGMINLIAKFGSEPTVYEYEATVLEAKDGKVLTVSAYIFSASEETEVWLEYSDNAQIDADISVGDKVKITSSGIIVDTAPPIISGVTRVVKIAE